MSASIPPSSASSNPAPVSNANCTEKVKNFMTKPTMLAITGIVAGAILMIVAFVLVLSKVGTITTATAAGALIIAGLATIIARQVKQRQEAAQASKKDTAPLLTNAPSSNSESSHNTPAPSTTA